MIRTTEERSSGFSRPEKRSPPTPTEKMHNAARNANGSSAQADSTNPTSTVSSLHEAAGGSRTTAAPTGLATGEKLNLDLFEWPLIYVSLSRKEKEDDFLAMKGTKLPQRPKKRAKYINKSIQYCFPGMWLSDLTKGRYEVREKKCVKKQRRGLKGMESLYNDSD